MENLQKNGVLHRLAQLDDDLLSLYGMGRRFEITIIGGSALIMLDLLPNERFTTDIDVLEASHEAQGLLERYDMNPNVSTFLYKYAENWKERRQPVENNGRVLDVFTMSNEDLAITKLLAWRKTDQRDLIDMLAAGSIDLDKLKIILGDVTEVQANLEDYEWAALLARFDMLLSGELE